MWQLGGKGGNRGHRTGGQDNAQGGKPSGKLHGLFKHRGMGEPGSPCCCFSCSVPQPDEPTQDRASHDHRLERMDAPAMELPQRGRAPLLDIASFLVLCHHAQLCTAHCYRKRTADLPRWCNKWLNASCLKTAEVGTAAATSMPSSLVQKDDGCVQVPAHDRSYRAATLQPLCP